MDLKFCTFTIPSDSPHGGKLSGGFDSTAKLKPGNALLVTVKHPSAATAPDKITGTFVYSAAPAASNQATPSPFLLPTTDKFVCINSVETQGVAVGAMKHYVFQPVPYGSGLDGQYELTFVATDNTDPLNPIQWSEDPEFDTGN